MCDAAGDVAAVAPPRRVREGHGEDDNGFAILHMSPELVVVDKPHDVAMDGERDTPDEVTVERWVRRFLTDFVAEPLPAAAGTIPGGGKPMLRDKALKFVHQLDYATSGVLCLAFSKDMARAMAHCFTFRQTRKEYSALLHGWIDDDRLELRPPRDGTVDERDGASAEQAGTVHCGAKRLAKSVKLEAAVGSRGAIVVDAPIVGDVLDPEGFRMRIAASLTDAPTEEQLKNAAPNFRDAKPQEALTVVSVLAHGYTIVQSDEGTRTRIPCTHVRLRLYTGRRHQLRVHCRSIGHPLIGDAAYVVGTPFEEQMKTGRAPRMMLHALRLTVGLDVAGFNASSAKERQASKRSRRRETLGIAAPGQPADIENVADGDSTTFESSDRLLEFFAQS